MKSRPILFSTDMVQAILAGKKTQTRRIVKSRHFLKNCPYGQPGDQLWVRETFKTVEKPIRDSGSGAIMAYDTPEYIYKADKLPHIQKLIKWKPSIFMPREASRITLEITDIRVEKLHNITEEDAIAEGFKDITAFGMKWVMLNGGPSWEGNPWVWVIKFKRIKG